MNTISEIPYFLKWILLLLPETTQNIVKKILREYTNILLTELLNISDLDEGYVRGFSNTSDDTEMEQLLEEYLIRKKRRVEQLIKALD